MSNSAQLFREQAIRRMQSNVEAVTVRLDRTERTVARAADAIEQQTANIGNLSANIDRLERGISQLVTEMSAQRETVNNLIRLERKAG